MNIEQSFIESTKIFLSKPSSGATIVQYCSWNGICCIGICSMLKLTEVHG